MHFITFKEEKNSCRKWFAFSAFLHLFFTLNSFVANVAKNSLWQM